MVNSGWKVVSEYGADMIDKGVDHDRYVIEKEGDKLDFEWDNWFEWSITGPESILINIAEKYSLNKKNGS